MHLKWGVSVRLFRYIAGSLGRGQGRMDGQLSTLCHFYMQICNSLYLKRHKFECQKELRSQVGSSHIITGLY